MTELERQSSTAAHWSQQQYEDLFACGNHRAQSERFAWVVVSDSEERIGPAGMQPEPLAFLVARRTNTEWELENIVVREAVRRRGIARLLLGEFVSQVRAEQGVSIFLEVRNSNQSARALYRKVGFEETGSRKSYYASPVEDAILCRLRL